MKKLSKFFKAIGLILQNPALLNNVLADEDVHKKEVILKYGLNKGLPTIDIAELLPGLNETVEPYSFLDGGSLPTDLALLKGLAKRFNDCCYLEIGTWRGESVSNVAKVAKECITVNLPDEEMRTMGLPEAYIKLHGFFSKPLSNVAHITANSFHFDFNSLNKKFDLVFIDGYHHYDNVYNDTLKVLPLLKNENSVIVWHDCGSSTEDNRWEVIHGILDAIPAEQRKYLFRVSNTLCAIYTKEKLNPFYASYPQTPNKFFSLNIKINPLPNPSNP